MSKKVKTKQEKKQVLKSLIKKLEKMTGKKKKAIFDFVSLDDNGIIKIHQNLQEAQKERQKNKGLEFFSKNEIESD